MIQNEKIKLLNAWKKNLFEELSISEIMKKTGKSSKPWVFNSIKVLLKNRLLLSKRKGNTGLYSLNISNPLLFQNLQYLESQELLGFVKLDIIIRIVNEVPIKTYCLLVFGSYAEDKQTKDSDLDICFLVEKKREEKQIKPYINDIKLETTVKIDEHYIIFSDFIKMLLREEENLGKQIYRKHRIFFNPDIYYQLVRGAYKNGFRQ